MTSDRKKLFALTTSHSIRAAFRKAKDLKVFLWVYRRLSSITTSVYVLFATAFLYLIGTVFPQGGSYGEYAKAGGRFVWAVEVFELLDFFTSPLFLVCAFILFSNLVVCAYDRYSSIFSKDPYPAEFKPTHTFFLTHNIGDAHAGVRTILRDDLGFKLLNKDSSWIVMERGLPYKLLTWLYHLGIIALFLGFSLTYLFAFEDKLTLWPGKTNSVAPSVTGRVQYLLGMKPSRGDWALILDEFITEYHQSPKLDYPKDKFSRLATGLGWNPPVYKLEEDSLFPKDWKSAVRVMQGIRMLDQKVIEVNDPMKFGGYTFYQEGFEQRLSVRIDSNPIPLIVKTNEDVYIPGVGGAIRFGILRNGRLFKLNGETEEIKPYASVKAAGKDGKEGFEDAGIIEAGGSIHMGGKRITLSDFEEGAALSYRYDPGAPLLWAGGIFVLVTMTLRLWGSWHILAYRVDENDGMVFLDIHVASKGLLADAAKLMKRLEYHLTRYDLKPAQMPVVAPSFTEGE